MDRSDAKPALADEHPCSAPSGTVSLTCVELFAGCGGLALGVARAGFRHALVVERDDRAFETLKRNKDGGVSHVNAWPLSHADVRQVSYSKLPAVDLVAGGPPCQPFSIGGRHAGPADERNMWPEALRAVRELRPRAFLFENVAGLLRPAFAPYLEFLTLQLSWPNFKPRQNESWEEHLKRLRAHAKRTAERDYRVLVQPINAADYGAPQKRHRAIFMGVSQSVADSLLAPAPTHSHDALVWSQQVSEEYWKRHGIAKARRPPITPKDARILERLQKDGRPPEEPWCTVRDVLKGLPEPSPDREDILNHRFHPGARVYPRHTGSGWDEPAKALKAGDHGVPGGENTLVVGDGTVRYFTLREMARLQGFPDDFAFGEGWKRPIRQLGNAVPVHIGEVFGKALREVITWANDSKKRLR